MITLNDLSIGDIVQFHKEFGVIIWKGPWGSTSCDNAVWAYWREDQAEAEKSWNEKPHDHDKIYDDPKDDRTDHGGLRCHCFSTGMVVVGHLYEAVQEDRVELVLQDLPRKG